MVSRRWMTQFGARLEEWWMSDSKEWMDGGNVTGDFIVKLPVINYIHQFSPFPVILSVAEHRYRHRHRLCVSGHRARTAAHIASISLAPYAVMSSVASPEPELSPRFSPRGVKRLRIEEEEGISSIVPVVIAFILLISTFLRRCR